MMRRFALVVTLLSLAGCTGLPVSGPVLVGGPIGVEIRSEVDYLPAGPSEGASQREILDGFIAAGASPQSNYRIARSFLADSAAANWNPARETVVRGDFASVETLTATTLAFSADVSARVDDRGVYQLAPTSSVATWEFGFTQVGGEWRLDQLPDLTVLTEVAFASAYDEYTVYFYNHDRTAFIPDVRIFARLGDPVTAVARATIAGPSEYLPTASTAFPTGSELVVAPVEVERGRAVVDVSEAVQQASTEDQRDMLSQIGVSLGQLGGVTSSALSVNRIALTVSAIPGIESNPRVDDRPLIVYDGVVGYSDGPELE
ncbi:MAG: GerMN domain-containing protein, partial [Microbacteriaceae bacterium]|nr:GerMN domain-containing protein [Microbacteriaceae bacterium]